jgi:predicted nucleic acid-binding protein
MIYVLDTNVISDLSRNVSIVVTNHDRKLKQGHSLVLCSPVYYENLRGLLKKNANSQIAGLNALKAAFDWQALIEQDWLEAAQLWANADKMGKRLSDIDVLIAALVTRLNAVLVSADADFDALPIKREDWRLTTS